MPRPSDWFQRVPGILALLNEPGLPPLLNRQMIQTLFGVERRNAQYLLSRFGATRFGNALMIDRLLLITALEGLAAQDEFALEVRRHQKVRETLADRRTSLQMARIVLPEPAAHALGHLPPSIRLAPGSLQIEFKGAIDLLTQLLELSQAIGSDFERFEGLLAQDPLVE